VTPPSWRFDIRIEEDLIEEVIRILGYDKLPLAPPSGRLVPVVPSEALRGADAVRQRLAALGYRETINFSFVEERWERELAGNADPIRVVNPIASPLAVMRSSLIGSLVEVLRFNLARKAGRVRVFESGKVFRRDAAATDGPVAVAGLSQPTHVAGLAWGASEPPQWGIKDRPTDFYDVKGDIEALCSPTRPVFVAAPHPAMHPGRSARIEVDGIAIGFIGELHPRWRQAYELPSAPVLFELEQAALSRRTIPLHRPLPRQQSSWRDIAVIAGDTVTHDALMQAIMAVPGGLVRSARLFDVYQPAHASADIGPNERSLAVRLEIRDDATTLTDERIDGVVAEVLDALRQGLGLRLRG
jgi:phenylalanyl-tRNA synthetase beta chain